MKIIEDAKMADHLWYKIGGIAKYLIECSSKEDVVKAFKFIKKENLPAGKAGIEKYFVIGLGSNLLFTDEYFDGTVIQIVAEGSDPVQGQTLLKGNIVEAFAGVELDQVIQFAFENNLVGLEWAGGLPGTVGAAVRGNVGAFGSEIKDTFYSAEVLDVSSRKYQVLSMNRRDIKFDYRMSTVKKNHNMIVLSAQFKLQKADDGKLSRGRQTYFGNIEYRKNKHPLEFPNTGSAFKNITKKEDVEKVLEVFPDIEQDVRIKWHGKVSMGYLIKRLDLSGLQIGNAQISNKHSNFIVNLGGASFSDVNSIILRVQEEFESNFGFKPEPEVEILT